MTRKDSLTPRAQALVAFLEAQEYICPWGDAWDKLWKMLPGRKQQGTGGWEPALPFILTGWYISDDAQKKERLLEHIAWADQRGVIEKVDRYLRELAPEKWHRREPQKPSNPLARAAAQMKQEALASGHTVKELEQPPTNRLQATFIPRRPASPPSPIPDDDTGKD